MEGSGLGMGASGLLYFSPLFHVSQVPPHWESKDTKDAEKGRVTEHEGTSSDGRRNLPTFSRGY